jgi:hypothetical protein
MQRFVMVLVVFLVVTCGVAAPASAAEPADAALFKPAVPPGPTGDTFMFVVIGDTRPQKHGRIEMPQQFLDNIAEVNRRRPVFSINVGDLIYGYEDDLGLVEREWDAYLEAVKTFEQPLFSVIGNHDVFDEPSEGYFLKRFGGLRWYSFDYGPAHFIVLDSDVAGGMDKIVGEQLEWLKQDLEASKDKALKFAFLHKPLWREGYGGQWNEDVHPLLVEHGVTAVFAGHEHRYLKDEPRDGVAYYITGGGGAELRGVVCTGDFHHFMEVTVSGDTVKYAVNRLGTMLPDDFITNEQVAAMYALEAGPVTPTAMPQARPDEGLKGTLRFELANPTPYVVDYALSVSPPAGGEADAITPSKGRLAPGGKATHEFRITAPAPGETRALGRPVIRADYDVGTPHAVSKVKSETPVGIGVVLPATLPGPSDVDRFAQLDGRTAAVEIPFFDELNVTGPFTIEAWFNVEEVGDLTGGLAHTEGSSYALLLSDQNRPEPRFYMWDAKAGRYAEATAEGATPLGRWVHIACTSDGEKMTLWIDGQKAAEADAPAEMTTNSLPMYIGADPMGPEPGVPHAFLKGCVDEFRFSTVCRYTEAFTPAKRFEPDEDTLILYHLDRVLVNRIIDYSGNGHHGVLLGDAVLVER